MERAVEGDDLVGTVLRHLPPLARQLDRPLVGLGTAVGEEHPVERAVPPQRLGEP
jgi:hypothetical protein